MIKVIDIGDNGITTQELLESLDAPGGAILRRCGHVIGRLEPADEIDLEDEEWTRQPEQIERGRQAREDYEQGRTISHEQLKRELGLDQENK